MKKCIAIVLVLMLCAAPAMAASWEEGRSPSQPYAGVPAVDLSKQIGYMMFYPNEKMSLQGGGRTLNVYLPRDDAEAGEGTFYLATEEGEVWRTVFNNTESVERREMTEQELKGLLWGSGTCFQITVPKSLEIGKSYFVNMDSGCITANSGEVSNPTIGGTDAWKFDVVGDYGVNNMEYLRPIPQEEPEELEEDAAEEGDEEAAEAEPTEEPAVEYEDEVIVTPQPGDHVRMDVLLGGEATMAVAYGINESVSFDNTVVEASGELVGKVLKEDPSFGLVFLNAQGEEIFEINF